MGKRWNEDCHNCGGEGKLECYSNKKHLVWQRKCKVCWYDDKRDYYELDNRTELVTFEEAIKIGALLECPLCSKFDTAWWIKQTGWCIGCQHRKKIKEQNIENAENNSGQL